MQGNTDLTLNPAFISNNYMLLYVPLNYSEPYFFTSKMKAIIVDITY